MVLQRWYPAHELGRAEDRMNRLWQGFFGNGYTHEQWSRRVVPLDVVEEDDNILVRASVPGVKPKDIEVTLDDGVLTIKGESAEESESNEDGYLLRERRAGSFHRALRLPETADTEKVESEYENGVLTVTIQKQEAKKARRIDVQVAA